ncbi:MAG TPA: serine hydrolase [Candidatus Acidoferrales bacterium]|nr:serine hydrolase [Candidatus Acidoferrales bacterium]
MRRTAFYLPTFCFLIALILVPFPLLPAQTGDSRLDQARTEIDKKIAASGAEVALVFLPLDGKRGLEIRPDDSFHAASTMKLGVMLELFRQVHEGTLHLEDPLPVRNQFHSIVDGSVFQLNPADDSDDEPYTKVGSTMTLEQLCEHMITRSSNLATNLLMEKLGIANIARTVEASGAGGLKIVRVLEDQKAFDKGISNTVTARALATLLERIAQAKAVDRASSEQMVAILKRQTFNDAIPAGLPAGTPVAHKTGDITRIHHDAAIVYAPRPFVLVLLVRGIEQKDKSAALMAEIAHIVYQAAE